MVSLIISDSIMSKDNPNCFISFEENYVSGINYFKEVTIKRENFTIYTYFHKGIKNILLRNVHTICDAWKDKLQKEVSDKFQQF